MAKHIRTLQPPEFNIYRKFKEWVRKEFFYNCIYCNANEPERGSKSNFAVEHYLPKGVAQFKHLETEYSNLYYACSVCNGYKGTYYANGFVKLLGKVIVNPCDHDIDLHIDKRQYKWQGISTEGQFTVSKLRLDSKANQTRIKDREVILQIIKVFEDQLQILKDSLKICQGANNPASVSLVQLEINKSEQQIESLKNKLYCIEQLQ
jgi:hypothetical protein